VEYPLPFPSREFSQAWRVGEFIGSVLIDLIASVIVQVITRIVFGRLRR
jgi:hypothetical protein